MINVKKIIIDIVEKHLPGCRVYLFGSRARNDHASTGSDYDEVFWKMLLISLERKLGVFLSEKGPKPVIRAAHAHNLIAEQEAIDLLQMVTDRNNTAHAYDEQIAETVAVHAQYAHDTMSAILQRLAIGATD